MTTQELKVEIGIKSIEFDQALNKGLPHAEIIHLYKQLKELKYQLVMAELKETKNKSTTEIIE
jgi:hypothetical protein